MGRKSNKKEGWGKEWDGLKKKDRRSKDKVEEEVASFQLSSKLGERRVEGVLCLC